MVNLAAVAAFRTVARLSGAVALAGPAHRVNSIARVVISKM